mmetsp:Transcript_13668/g.29330  ORF Transcript_13668/g.29330 Transcript_13668/m.29330 type:complete len:420 (-) Transcript_13668:692-1951(-)|eukprot:CAMPEP_0202891680 /NCGR_PEP_ID=MMETSP1392-20130828/1680_1 /ASSEMBLY_ACC=CAM_ASM_000868 /TAXON_ID=225041 /ORGANISM="Chlamydomonas chlamydogama, Strain SAG 11-48b" /LENGTH=419 /DNA_ID=CAMNT_0049575505 /DNA_START=272 /DNA_END=1531 /DNA_ORIENTATION=+
MNGNLNNIMYLEAYVESTASMPPELQRILNTIKALDEKCSDLSETLQHNVAVLISFPPMHAQRDGPTDEYLDLLKRVEQDQRMLLQFAEEKVQLAQQAFDLVEMHAIELEKQLDEFEGDLRVTGGLDGTSADLYSPSFGLPLDSARGRTPKIDDWNSLAPTPSEQLPLAPLPSLPVIKRVNSTVAQKGSNKRPRDEPDVPAAAPPPPAPASTPTPAAPVQATTPAHQPPAAAPLPPAAPASGAAAPTALAAVPTQGPAAPVATTPSGPPPGAASIAAQQSKKTVHSTTSLMASTPSMDETTVAAAAATGGFEAPEAPEQATPQVGFMKPPPAGFKDAAPRPQAAGHYLYAGDITPRLSGRHAELFWPDDGMWYLIEIQEVSMDTKMARIVYTTGEVENLNLEEIAKEMHMVLIPLDFYR